MSGPGAHPAGGRSSAQPDSGGANAGKPRLLIVGPLPPPFGGVQLMIDMQRRSSLAREFDIHIVDTSKRRLRITTDRPTLQTPLYFLRDFRRVAIALARIRPAVVLVHAAADLSFLRDWAMMIAARASGARVVCHYHGTLHARFPSCETRAGRMIGRALMAAAQRVVVLSPTYRREMSAAWQRSTVSWSPNTVDVPLYRDMPADTAAPWLQPGERGVLFVGRLSAPKGIHDLFKAIPLVLAQYPQTRFVMVGVAENEASETALRAEAARLGIAGKISFLGALDGREKAAAFVTSRLIVVPSWTEAFPLVIPEAMAAGLPVIATAVGAIPDFITDCDDGFLIMPKDSRALADRICRVLGDEALRLRMSNHVRERAAREFDVEVGAARIAALVKSLLDDNPRADIAVEGGD